MSIKPHSNSNNILKIKHFTEKYINLAPQLRNKRTGTQYYYFQKQFKGPG